ncbi:MAG: hypothetical protein CL885_01030 [Dehalococcoidia bacterium]|nr:hypothetical protein [Dehalococcoidia bacterium]
MNEDMYNKPLSERSDEDLLSMYYDSPMRDRMDIHQPLLGEVMKRWIDVIRKLRKANKGEGL